MDRVSDGSGASGAAIEQGMRELVAQSLAVDLEAVTPTSRLTTELGASSLDFVDMIFMIEKRFGVKLRDGELELLQKLDFSSPAVLRDGVITKETVERLEAALPALAAAPDRTRLTPRELFGLITVSTLVGLVERRLAERAG